MNKGCDAVMRLHQGRLQKGKKRQKYTVDPPFKKKKKTRRCPPDRLILWEKPKRKTKDISREDFDSIPKELVLREIHYYICIPGFRTKEIIVVTTLIDAVKYPVSAILDLYDSRWEAEINLRHIKTTLGMDILSCQTPEMVRKEIYTYLLVYNLLRSVMYEAGTTFDRNPVRLSFQSLSINARASECFTGKNEICLTSGFRLKLAAFDYELLVEMSKVMLYL